MQDHECQIYLRARRPNPLFQGWLEQWLVEAQRKDSRKRFALAKALEALNKYPLVLHSGRDCSILDGFGNGICAMLDEQLKVYKNKNPWHLLPDANEVEQQERTLIDNVQSLLEENEKDDVQTEVPVMERCIASDAGIEKEEVLPRQCHPDDIMGELFMKYGSLIEREHFHTMQSTKQSAIAPPTTTVVEKNQSRVCTDTVRTVVAKHTYEIVLLIDTAETTGKSKRALDATIHGLNVRKVTYEVRRLSVGDFLWVCKDTSGAGHELVLPYIVERKRMDDLASSIKDGRFHEQKFRLTDSGLENVVYLIESRGSNSHLGLPMQNLLQATTNTQIHNQFCIKFTDSHNDSLAYLSVMTKLLVKMFQDKSLIVVDRDAIDRLPVNYYKDIANVSEVQLMSFKDFTDGTMKMKNFTIRDLFLRQLIQLKALTIDKAMAITDIYPTPQHLIKKYRQCRDKHEAENLLSNILFGKMRKPIGSVISKIIYNFYHTY